MAGLQRVRFAAYQEHVRTRIMKTWVLPLPPEESRALQATVLFRVARDGHIDRLDLVQSSGNALFDASLVRAIKRASPLPELPADYARDVLEVEMRFSAREPSAG
jgi:colicin import membrane protein